MKGRDATPTSTQRGAVASIAVALLTVLIVLRPHEAVTSLAIVRPVILGILITLALVANSADWRVLRFEKLFLAYVTLLAVALVGVPFALYRGGTLPIVQKLAIIVTYVGIVLALKRDQRLERTIATTYLYGFVAFCLLVIGKSVVSIEAGRLSGFSTYDPNDLAALCSLSVALSIGELSNRRFVNKVVAVLAIILGVYVLIRTGSRGGTFALAAVLLISIAAVRGRRRVLVIVTGAALAVASWTFAPEQFRERIASIGNVGGDYNVDSYGGRLSIWKRGLTYFSRNPLTGVGVNNFSEAEGQTQRRDSRTGAWLNAHNMFIQALAETGLPGIVAFLTILATSLSGGIRRWRHSDRLVDRMPLAASISFVVSGMFLSHAYMEMLAFVACLSTLRSSTPAQISFSVARVRQGAAMRLATRASQRTGAGSPRLGRSAGHR